LSVCFFLLFFPSFVSFFFFFGVHYVFPRGLECCQIEEIKPMLVLHVHYDHILKYLLTSWFHCLPLLTFWRGPFPKLLVNFNSFDSNRGRAPDVKTFNGLVCGLLESLRRLCEASASKWLLKTCWLPFPQKPVLRRSHLVTYYSSHSTTVWKCTSVPFGRLFVCLFVCWNKTRKTILRLLCWTFLSFFLGFRRPNLITGLSGWPAPD